MINENGDVHSCLIFGKSRVALVKYVSIPRLELTAAILSVKLSDMLRESWIFLLHQESFGHIVNLFWVTCVMRLSDLKSLLPIMFSSLEKAQMFDNEIMYPLRVILEMIELED